MSLPSKLLETTQAHLEQLVAERAQESAHLEFKRELPTRWDAGNTQEFLADVTAMANATGGDLIYGIDEGDNAEAKELIPQDLDADVEVRRLSDFLLNSVEPRIPGVQVRGIAVETGGKAGIAVVVRIPQSWAGPHRVTPTRKFHIRENGRKRDLSVPEIRGLFLRSEGQAQRVRDFRTERLGKILIGDLPCKLAPGPLMVVHIVPLQSALGLVRLSPTQYGDTRHLPVVGTTAAQNFINMDGLLSTRGQGQDPTHGYTQLFRDGVFESVRVWSKNAGQAQAVLPTAVYESQLNKFLADVRAEMAFLGVTGEVSMFLSLLRADEIRLGVRQSMYENDGPTGGFDRKTIVLPDVVVAMDEQPGRALKPMFDYVWQCAGFVGSPNYDTHGNWVAEAQRYQ